MARRAFTPSRYVALQAVHHDHVRYHTGGSGPAVGYTWSEDRGGQMPNETRDVLHELWTADLIEVDTHRLFAQHGHRVATTMSGYLLLCEWASLHQQVAA